MMESSKSDSQSEGSLALHNEGSEHGSDMVFEKTLLAPYAVHQTNSTSTKKGKKSIFNTVSYFLLVCKTRGNVIICLVVIYGHKLVSPF